MANNIRLKKVHKKTKKRLFNAIVRQSLFLYTEIGD